MQYADNRELRERMYHAYATRASEFGNPAWDNTALISEILKLRANRRQLLASRLLPELSLQPKMADTPGQVLGFLEELAIARQTLRRARPGRAEGVCREAIGARRAAGLGTWPMRRRNCGWRATRSRIRKSNSTFPEQQVLAGMFRVVATLYGLSIAADECSVAHRLRARRRSWLSWCSELAQSLGAVLGPSGRASNCRCSSFASVALVKALIGGHRRRGAGACAI